MDEKGTVLYHILLTQIKFNTLPNLTTHFGCIVILLTGTREVLKPS